MDPIRKGYADTEFGQVHFRRVDGGGAPVILLHRTPVDSSSFDGVLRLLAGKRTAIALDTPGFGASFRPEGSPSAADYGRWFLAAARSLGLDKFHIAAHHTGTHFAVEMARAAPNRVLSLLLSGILYLDPASRADVRTQIGDALPIDAEGDYLAKAWATMKSVVTPYEDELIHTETLGALASPEGRNQAFTAILNQSFSRVLSDLECPVRVLQAQDDPLSFCLDNLRNNHPGIPVTLHGPAGIAAPERQPHAFASGVLHSASAAEAGIAAPAKIRAMTNRQFLLNRTPTGFDLAKTEGERPQAGPGEVVINVKAVSLNRRDLMIRELTYPVFADSFTPLSDAAGDVVEVGEGVTSVAVGDRVTSTFFQDWQDGRITFPAVISALGSGGRGVLADYIVLSAEGIAPIPKGLSYEAAATLPCAGVTAWFSLVTAGGIKAGDWVLVMGTGGVALFGLQIAVAMGAKVAVISSSDEKLEQVKRMGASVTVNYNTTPDWEVAIKEATGGVDHVLELGGSGTLPKSQASLGIGGHLALIGALAGFGGDLSATGMVMGCQRASAITVGPRADHLALAAFIEKHGIEPQIDKVFELDAINEAYASADKGAFGKVVVRL